MKKTLLMLLLASASTAFAQKPIKVQGKIEGDASVAKITLQLGKEDKYNDFLPEETIEVKKGKFAFTKQINSIVPAYIKPGDTETGRYYKVLLIPGENLKLTIKENEFFYDGSKVYKEMNDADLAVTPLMQDYETFYRHALNTLDATPEDQQQAVSKLLSDTLRIKGQARTEGIKNYYNSNKDKEGALLYLMDSYDVEAMYSDVKSKYMEEHGNQEEGLLDNRVAKYLKQAIDYTVARREAQRKAQEERQAKLDAMKGAPAKDFTLNDLNGKPLALSSLRGKYVILDFWGSWCGWCIKGIPDMKVYYDKYKSKLEILGVDCNDTEEKWKDAVAKYELPWLHVYNPRSSSVLSDYGVTGFPTKIIIDPEGNVNKVIVGEDPAFYTYLDELLGK